MLVRSERRPHREVERHRRGEVAALDGSFVLGVLLVGREVEREPGHGAGDMRDRPDSLRSRERCVERQRAAQREPDERGPVDVQRVEHGEEIVERRELVAWRLGAAVVPVVVADRAEAVREPLGDGRPEP